jgi:hypothetical protein
MSVPLIYLQQEIAEALDDAARKYYEEMAEYTTRKRGPNQLKV